MSEMNNLNELKCEYYIPMGKPGSIVIKAPVVLSTLKISIPINKRINLNSKSSRIEIISNKISIKKPKFNKDNRLVINGYIHKYIKYFNNNSNKNIGRNLEVKIPINSEILINFDQMPIYNPVSNKNIFYEESKAIKCDFECIKLISDYIAQSEYRYFNDSLLELTVTLTQIQNIFIPEPDGDFVLITNNLKPNQFKNNGAENKNSHYLVGYDSSRGLIANIIEPNKKR